MASEPPAASSQQPFAIPQPAPVPGAAQAASPPTKQSLKKWWQGFRPPAKSHEAHGKSSNRYTCPPSIHSRIIPKKKSIPKLRMALHSSFRESRMDSRAPALDGFPSEADQEDTNGKEITPRFSLEGSESDTLRGSTQHLFTSDGHSSSALRETVGNCPLIRAKRCRSVSVPSSNPTSINRNGCSSVICVTFTADRDRISSDTQLGAGALPGPRRRSFFHFFRISESRHLLSIPSEEKAKLNTVEQPTGIFGVPLRQSITYANVAISLVDGEGKSYIYGYVPIVVAKCGVYLKEKGRCSLCHVNLGCR